MTPRTQMWALHADATAADVIAAAVASGSSRFPLYGAGLDEVTGLVHVKHAVAVPEDRRGDGPAEGLGVAVLTAPSLLRVGGLVDLLRGGDGRAHRLNPVKPKFRMPSF